MRMTCYIMRNRNFSLPVWNTAAAAASRYNLTRLWPLLVAALFFYKSIKHLMQYNAEQLVDVTPEFVNPTQLNNSALDNNVTKKTSNKTASLCLVIKDQNLRYIDEWADYHMALGFTGLRLYDNTKEFVMKNWGINKPYSNGIQRIHFLPNITHKITEYKTNKRNNTTTTAVTKFQDAVYMDCVRSAKRNGIDWVAAFDVDEFLVLKNYSSSVVEFMEEYCEYPCGQISFNTIRFGSAENQSRYFPVLVTRRFQYRDNLDDGIYVKAIVNPLAVKQNEFWIHTFPLNKPWLWKDTSGRTLNSRDKRGNKRRNKRWNMQFNHNRPIDVAVFHHYQILSREEFHDRVTVRQDVNRLSVSHVYPNSIRFQVFDDTAWQILRKLVPSYQKYDNMEKLS